MSSTPADDNPLPENDPGQPLDQDVVAPGEGPDEVSSPTAAEAEQPAAPEMSLEQQLADAEQSLLRGKAELEATAVTQQ